MIIVLGLPGSGKSTIMSSLKNSTYKRINYGDLMFEIGKSKFGVASRDLLRTLPAEKQKEIQAQVAISLSKETGHVLLDTHCSISTPQGYLPGLPYPLLSKLKVDCLVLIRAPVEQIIARRQKDPTRKRDADEKEKLDEQDRINLGFLSAYSALTGAPAKVINNLEGKVEAAAKELELLMQ